MKSKEETFALNRIVHIITDLRPLLQDRARAVTPDGYVLWDCLNEMEEIARTLAGTIAPVTLQTVTEGEDNVATNGEPKPENQGTEGAGTQPKGAGGAVRKSNAREKHEAAIATGSLEI